VNINDIRKSEVSIFFSGVESDKYFNIVAKETSTMLMSFHYLQRKGKKFIQGLLEVCPNLQLIVDSGAHTFMNKEEYENKPIEYWEKYLDKYTKWALENKDHVYAIAELDIEGLVGVDTVNRWREEYFKPLEEQGVTVIYVWHACRDLKDWETMCNKYDYVGISLNEKEAEYDDKKLSTMFNLAKKHLTLVHGFAVTGFDMMCSYPWRSVDSTTWLIGTQYGEINYFDGRCMKRLKKDKWKRQFKNKLIKLGANWALAEREEPYELIRINVLTFLEVEAHVRKRIKTKSYWLSNKGVKVVEEDIEELPRGTLPAVEWFDGDCVDWKPYAKVLGIDTNGNMDEVISLIGTFKAFIEFDKEKLDMFTTEELFAFCDVFGVSDVNTSKKALEALPQCFKDHADRKRSEYSNLSEEEVDLTKIKGKEREQYIEEEQTIALDLSKKDCDSYLAGLLGQGSDMPEVDAYDDELRKQGIVVVRDEKGKFLKGQKHVRKPKKIYSDSMYQLSCSTCYKSGDCPDYQAGYVCAYNKMFKRFSTRNRDDLMDAMHSIVEGNLERLQRMMMFEMMDGGMVDANVTSLMDTNMKYLQMMTQMETMGKQIVAQRKVVVDENGTVETIEEVRGNGDQGGILSRLFGGMSFNTNKEANSEEETIDITPEKKD